MVVVFAGYPSTYEQFTAMTEARVSLQCDIPMVLINCIDDFFCNVRVCPTWFMAFRAAAMSPPSMAICFRREHIFGVSCLATMTMHTVCTQDLLWLSAGAASLPFGLPSGVLVCDSTPGVLRRLFQLPRWQTHVGLLGGLLIAAMQERPQAT